MEKVCYCDDLYTAYQSMKLTDLTLNCEPDPDGSHVIEVHRLVMGCASQEILDKISARDSNPILHLPYTVSTMKILVALAYGRQVKISSEMIPQLQEAAVDLKMNDRIRNYVEQCARPLADTSLLEDNNDGPEVDSCRRRLTDGDLTPELFFTPEDQGTSPEKHNRRASSPLQEIVLARGDGSQTLGTQDSVQLVQERISVVIVDSSSDDELVELNKTHRQRPHKKLPIKTVSSVKREDTQTRNNATKRSSQRGERNLRSSISDSSDDSMSRSPKLLKMEEGISTSTISRAQEEVDAQEVENNLKRETTSGVSTRKQISNAATNGRQNAASSASSANDQQAARSRIAWCTRAVSDIQPLQGNTALAKVEWKLLDSILVDVEDRPPRNRLKRMARLVQILEFKRLENLCNGCLKFQDDIKGHMKSCLKKQREPRKKYVSCEDCGTPFSHAPILRYHICKNKLSGKETDGLPLDCEDI